MNIATPDSVLDLAQPAPVPVPIRIPPSPPQPPSPSPSPPPPPPPSLSLALVPSPSLAHVVDNSVSSVTSLDDNDDASAAAPWSGRVRRAHITHEQRSARRIRAAAARALSRRGAFSPPSVAAPWAPARHGPVRRRPASPPPLPQTPPSRRTRPRTHARAQHPAPIDAPFVAAAPLWPWPSMGMFDANSPLRPVPAADSPARIAPDPRVRVDQHFRDVIVIDDVVPTHFDWLDTQAIAEETTHDDERAAAQRRRLLNAELLREGGATMMLDLRSGIVTFDAAGDPARRSYARLCMQAMSRDEVHAFAQRPLSYASRLTAYDIGAGPLTQTELDDDLAQLRAFVTASAARTAARAIADEAIAPAPAPDADSNGDE